MRLFFAGSANIDLTFQVGALPRPGVTEVCASYFQGFGGKGANQAVQAARLGASVAFLGNVGDDPFGPAMLRQLQSEGIDTSAVGTVKGVPTGTAVILVEPTGQNSIVASAGPNVALTADDVRAASKLIAASDAVIATLEVPGEPLLELLQIARAARVRTILNPAPPVLFPREALQHVDICVPNESELAALTVPNLDPVEAARRLSVLGPSEIVITLGDQGALVVDRDGHEQIPAKAVRAVDTSGAGDSFTAALAVALAEGRDLRQAARWANAVAAISVTRSGTQASFPKRAEVPYPDLAVNP